jgi:HNH endonuclease
MRTRIYAPKGENQCSVIGCNDTYYGSTFCKKHHQWHWRRGLLPKPVEISITDKLKAYSMVDPVTGCWIWMKGRNDRGYGVIVLPGQKSAYASRVSYETFIGQLGDKEACHKCDNPPCINPDHLFAGTHQENMRDSMAKGRNRRDLNTGKYIGTELDLLANIDKVING